MEAENQRKSGNLIRLNIPDSNQKFRLNSWKSGIDRHLSTSIIRQIQQLIHNRINHGNLSEYQKELNGRLSRYFGLPETNFGLFSGHRYTLERLIKSFCRYGEKAVISGPADDETGLILDKYGIRNEIHYGPSPFTADPDGLIASAREARIVFLNNPNHLSGTEYSRFDIELILSGCPRAILVIDDAGSQYPGDSLADLVAEYRHLIILKSFGRTMGLDTLPVSCLLAHRDTLAEYDSGHISEQAKILRVAAATAVLNHLDRLRIDDDQMGEIILCLMVRLRRVGVTCRTGCGNHLLIRVDNPARAQFFLKKAGFVARNLGRYKQLDGYLSLAISVDCPINRLVEAFERMPAGNYWRTERRSRDNQMIFAPDRSFTVSDSMPDAKDNRLSNGFIQQ